MAACDRSLLVDCIGLAACPGSTKQPSGFVYGLYIVLVDVMIHTHDLGAVSFCLIEGQGANPAAGKVPSERSSTAGSMPAQRRSGGNSGRAGAAASPSRATMADKDDEKSREASVSGLYLFLAELITVILVASKAIIHNGGRKFVRLAADPECVVRWVDITSNGSEVACCRHPIAKDHWHADICERALSPSTKYMTTMLAWVIPLATLMLNTLFSYSLPREVQESQRRRLGLYLAIMAFRSFILLWLLNTLEDLVQGHEGIECWYSDLTRSKRCRENFDFADHTVLFLSHYLAITTFEVLAVLREHTSMLHLLCCLSSAMGIILAALFGLYGTVAYFHSRLESAVGIAIAVVTVHAPLMLIVSGRLKSRPWLQLKYYIAR